MRDLVAQTTLSPKDFICPVFVQEDLKERVKVKSMSGIERIPLSDLNDEVASIIDLGIPAIMLFGIPAQKIKQEVRLLIVTELFKKQFLKSR